MVIDNSPARSSTRPRRRASKLSTICRGISPSWPGPYNGHTGWRGALQQAANVSRNDSWVLLIADEVYTTASDLTSAAGVRAYAASTMLVVHGGAGRFVLDGMRDYAESQLRSVQR